MATGDGACKHSCRTATETLEWIHAIIDFLKPYRFFLDAHVVNFFNDRLWEAVDEEWIDCLRKEPVDRILQIPSGASPDRCRALGEAAGLHNFGLHIFRAAFQMVLLEYFPEVVSRSPTIGRQGKALRRQLNRRILESSAGSTWVENPLLDEPSAYPKTSDQESHSVDRYSTFVKFCKSGLGRLGLHDSQHIEYSRVWKEAEEFSELVGAYWTLRAALGPVLETLLLLDRLLFLQEQGNARIHAFMVPIFDPVLSPTNVALIAQKV